MTDWWDDEPPPATQNRNSGGSDYNSSSRRGGFGRGGFGSGGGGFGGDRASDSPWSGSGGSRGGFGRGWASSGRGQADGDRDSRGFRGRGRDFGSSDGRGPRGFGGRGRGRGGGRGRGRRDFEHAFEIDDSWQNGNDKEEREEDMTISSTTINILPKDTGKLIGKQGAKIKELEEESGAKIKILKEESNVFNTPIELTGTPSAIQRANKLIEELTRPEVQKVVQTERKPPRINWGELRANKEINEAKKWAGLPDVVKNFYFEDPEVANMYPEELERIRKENNNIVVTDMSENEPRSVPNPVVTFEQAFMHYPEVLSEIEKAGFVEPSPIQKQAWPIILQGLDMIGIAQTGTGKTLAFLLPAMLHIEGQPTPRSQRTGPNVLVLSPTRELALQIESEVKKYHYKGIKCVCVYGGGNRREQINIVTKGVEIVIATPGRLNDLVMNNIIDVKSVTFLVLDEADRMLDMGFEPQIMKILLDIRPDRQTIMTSATWPEGVRRLSKKYMKDPMMVFIGTLDLAAVHSVTQRIEIIEEEYKRERLIDFLMNELQEDEKVIVFVGRKTTADDISSDFALNDIPCQCIHGDREQSDREQALEDIKSGEVRILVATDVASRGLDVKDITHVFNYDFPRNMEEYVHRIGRTGRAGRTGTSLTLLTRRDWRSAKQLIGIMEEANQEVPQELHDMAARFEAWKERNRDEDGRSRRGGFGGGGFGGGGGGFGGGGGGFGGGGGGFGGRRGGRRGAINISSDFP